MRRTLTKMKHLIVLLPLIGIFQTACDERIGKKNTPIIMDTVVEKITPPKICAYLTNHMGELIATLDSTSSHFEEISGGLMVTHNLITPPGCQYRKVLPDSTMVWLNVGSALSYPLDFSTERKVWLRGEAYFKIEPRTWKGKKIPFRILTATKGSSTRTEIESENGRFNVDANGDDVVVRLAVEKGIVKVTCPRDNPHADPTRIVANEKCVATVTEGGGITLSKNVPIQRYTNWKTYPFDVFDFYNADFKEIRGQLERWFDIKIDTSIKGKRIDAIMDRDATIEEVIRAIELFTGVATRLKGRTLVSVK